MPHQPTKHPRFNMQVFINYIYNLFPSKTQHPHAKSSFSKQFYNISIQSILSFLQYLTYIPQQSARRHLVLTTRVNLIHDIANVPIRIDAIIIHLFVTVPLKFFMKLESCHHIITATFSIFFPICMWTPPIRFIFSLHAPIYSLFSHHFLASSHLSILDRDPPPHSRRCQRRQQRLVARWDDALIQGRFGSIFPSLWTGKIWVPTEVAIDEQLDAKRCFSTRRHGGRLARRPLNQVP